MCYDAIYCKFGELFLKGKNKHLFIKRIVKTIQRKIHDFENLELSNTNDHVLIMLNGTNCDDVLARLNQVFGLYAYALGRVCPSDLASICTTALNVVNENISPETSIKFETRRGWKQFPMNSIEASQAVAEYVGERCDVRYNIGNPDQIVRLLIKPQHTIVVAKEVRALGGLPLGINGRTLLMLSGGIDSPVAGYLMMKRGLIIDGLHFESPPHTSIRARQKVVDLAEKLAHFLPDGRMHIYMVPFTRLQKALFDAVPQSYTMTIMRRMMLRIAEAIAQKYDIPLLSTGDSLGQVASQTPLSIHAINSVTTMPIIRPVACMDKTEIIAVSKQINTFDISIRPYEDCCTVFVPKSPATNPKKEKCEHYETYFDWKPLLDECVENVERITIEAGKTYQLDDKLSQDICTLL